MRLVLTPHPDTPCAALEAIHVDVRRSAGRIDLRYSLTGDMLRLAGLPKHRVAQAGHRRDELWRATCLEAFLRPQNDSAYMELNAAPDGDWAVYTFSGYRQGMYSPAVGTPIIRSFKHAGLLEVELTLDTPNLMPLKAPWALALSAVIETTNKSISYWALAHPPGKPDFHHKAGFIQTLRSEPL